MTRGYLRHKLGGLLTTLDNVGVGFRVNEELCLKLEGCPNEMTKKPHTCVKNVNKLRFIIVI